MHAAHDRTPKSIIAYGGELCSHRRGRWFESSIAHHLTSLNQKVNFNRILILYTGALGKRNQP